MRKRYHQRKKQKKVNTDENEIIMAECSEKDDDDNETNQRTVQLDSAVVIINKRVTIPVYGILNNVFHKIY